MMLGTLSMHVLLWPRVRVDGHDAAESRHMTYLDVEPSKHRQLRCRTLYSCDKICSCVRRAGVSSVNASSCGNTAFLRQPSIQA